MYIYIYKFIYIYMCVCVSYSTLLGPLPSCCRKELWPRCVNVGSRKAKQCRPTPKPTIRAHTCESQLETHTALQTAAEKLTEAGSSTAAAKEQRYRPVSPSLARLYASYFTFLAFLFASRSEVLPIARFPSCVLNR